MSKMYKSMKGEVIDVGAIISKNENKIAAGNTKMNARGDELGANGAIIRPVRKKAQESHNMAKEVRTVGLKGDMSNEEVLEAISPKKEKKPAKQNKASVNPEKKIKEIEHEDGSIELVEDENNED